MADTPADNQDTDETHGEPGLSVEGGAPRRPDVAAGPWAPAVAAQVEAMGADELAAQSDDALLRAGTILLGDLGDGHADLAARCFAALEGREAAAGLARLGLAWVSWARGEADACADGLRAAA
ncbi:MAG: hypothetical protein KDK70_33520, partial [Myxococcales bacterium]|nr:hypothetical protein [Myxococcales bacterium]